MNSLDLLSPKNNFLKNKKFDLVLIDGDHNFYTVYHELNFLKDYIHDHTLIVCDDYNGKYSKVDMFYKDMPGYCDNSHLKQNIELELKGVKSAVDYFMSENPGEFKCKVLGPLEPCIMFKSGTVSMSMDKIEKHLSQQSVDFNLVNLKESSGNK